MKTSYSRLSTFSFCPKKFDYRYVQERPAPAKPELAFGSAIHAALEANFRQKIETRHDLSVEEAAAFFRQELAKELAPVPEDDLRGPNDPRYLEGLGQHFLARFLTERAPRLQPAPRGVETPFHLSLPGGHEISGKMDLIDTRWMLHDFKTAGKAYDPRRADKTQLVIYAWACERMFGRPPTALCFDVFVKGGAEGEGAMLQDPVLFDVPAPADMALVHRRLVEQIERILQIQAAGRFVRAFEPTRCRWCEYQGVCVEEWRAAGKPAPQKVTREELAG